MSVLATSSLWTAIAIPSAAVLGAIVTMTLTRVNEATNRRRDRYAEAVQTLVAWTEYPYRVRRRADDTPATLTALANHGHDLQERLALHEAWIATEHPALAKTYAATRATLDRLVGPLISEAWDHRPTGKASAMNLRGWGPSDECREAIAEVQREIQNRFGLRRFKLRMNPKRDQQTGLDQRSDVSDERSRLEIEAVDGNDASNSSNTEDGPPLWLTLSIVAVLLVGSIGVAVVGVLSGFSDLNKAFLALYALGALWGLGTGFWSFGKALIRLFKKAEPSLEQFVDWTSWIIWNQLRKFR